MSSRCTASGVSAFGVGGDVLQFRRSDPRYSPVCQVYQYNAITGSPARPMTVGELPQSEAGINALPGASPAPSPGVVPVGASPRPDDPPPRFIYCPQVE